GLSTNGLSGKVGAYPVGMQLTIRDHRDFVSGHYFYVRTLINIPLTGRMEGDTLTLQEPGGGVFRLHLVSNVPGRKETLTFYNSTSLAGTWTQGAKTLPVELGLTGGYDGPPRARHYEEMTDEPDAVFEARVGRFLKAVVRGDRAAAAQAVSYPLLVNGARPRTVRNRAELLARWDSIFTPAFVADLRNAVPHEMFVRQGMAMVGDGDVWFDAKGAKVINRR
ncbi:hypothetical protein CSW58_10970, partial [Caulobacter sp. B11]|uniref:hypothetical protein n=1 Tax=Caulobacter sp. B11 TaxID=2048899 RepID=UPI000C12AB48